jgi:Flp pilus assembly protein TadD
MTEQRGLRTAIERGEHHEVLRLTDAILAERPGDDAAHEMRARALVALGRLDEAEQHANDALRLDPDEIRYRELLAEILSARGAHRDAAGEYAGLSRDDPRQQAWMLAEASERLEAADDAGAVEAARRAVRLDPGDAAAQLALARGLTRAGDPAGALQAATIAAELRPGDAAAREVLADARWLAGDEAGAFGELRALALELPEPGRERAVAKARAIYATRARGLGRLLLAVPPLFRMALERGWVRVT